MSQNGSLARDDNDYPVMGGTSSSDDATIVNSAFDPITRRLLTDFSSGAGTVTSVSVVTANGFAGTVADPTTTPAITLSITVTGIVKGNGTALSAASAGTDYVAPGAITSSGLTQATARLLGRTTAGTGAIEEISVGTGLTFAAGSLSATGVAGSIVVGTTTITSGTTTRILYDNAGVLGEYTLTGTGTVVAMQTAPSFLTSITTPSVLASSNDSGAIGASGTAFSDLFLASGGVINWNAGDYTLTHSAGVLTANKDLRITTVGTDATSVPTLSSASTIANKIFSYTSEPGADDTAYGDIIAGFVAAGTLAQWDLVYLNSSSKWAQADGDAAATAGGVLLGLAMTAGTADNALSVLVKGIVRNDGWTWATVGGPLYPGSTVGTMVQTAVTGTDSVTRVLGYALTDDCIWFDPAKSWITHT